MVCKNLDNYRDHSRTVCTVQCWMGGDSMNFNGFLAVGDKGIPKAQQTPGQSETGKVCVASHRPLGFEICLLCLAKWCLGFVLGSRE